MQFVNVFSDNLGDADWSISVKVTEQREVVWSSGAGAALKAFLFRRKRKCRESRRARDAVARGRPAPAHTHSLVYAYVSRMKHV